MTTTITPQLIGARRRQLREAEWNLAYVNSDATLPTWLRVVVQGRADAARSALTAVEGN